jgi:hypothetical protein
MHPALQDAKSGIVRPAQPNSRVSAEEHNLGFVSGLSPFTSWTRDRQLALWHANRYGAGGVLLRVPAGAPLTNESWNWEQSEDLWYEDEVLMRGVRLNVEVVEI